MCGIAGILQSAGVAERRRRVALMSQALTHRGPDDHGAYDDDAVSLGFRRLAVIDLETGQQPIVLEDERAVIVLNGEIYNFRELRRELQSRYDFRSKGDVEVVLRLYDRDGIACLQRLNGMFALAIWDRRRRTLHLARDRFGIKPLYYCREGDTLAFASELRALRAAGFPSSPTLDLGELRHYLAFGYLSPLGSPFTEVRSLPPASVLTVTPDGEHLERYWSAPETAERAPNREVVQEELSARLAAAVQRQLVADVPVGVFLSGGLDSSTISALSCRVSTGRVSTFSVGFTEAEVVSELPGARQVAGLLGTDHHELVMDPRQTAEDLETIIGSLDAPLADATAIPTWYLSRLARQRVTVALSGEGADEVFGGYSRQRYDVTLERLGPAARLLVPAMLRLAGRRVSPRLSRRLGLPAGLDRQLDWGRVLTASEIDAVTNRQLPPERSLLEPYHELAERWSVPAQRDAVNLRLDSDREIFLPCDLLPKVDRMSMHHSLEVRVPFLDNEVVDLVLPLPGRHKVSLLRDKIVLRRVASQLLPMSVAHRGKQGFDVPISAWLRGPLADPLRSHLGADAVRRHGLLDPVTTGRLVGEHLAGSADHGRSLWALLVLQLWLGAQT